jgi:glycerol uptake facilitator-like aquaporin
MVSAYYYWPAYDAVFRPSGPGWGGLLVLLAFVALVTGLIAVIVTERGWLMVVGLGGFVGLLIAAFVVTYFEDKSASVERARLLAPAVADALPGWQIVPSVGVSREDDYSFVFYVANTAGEVQTCTVTYTPRRHLGDGGEIVTLFDPPATVECQP